MINIIVAASENNVIGKNNGLPWKLKADMKRFKDLTTHTTVIMGRKTFDSIGKPLPDRKNIVVTRQIDKPEFNTEPLKDISLEHALFTASLFSHSPEFFIIGGGEIYKQAIETNVVDKIYLTRVHTVIDGDTFFPDFNLKEEWILLSSEKHLKDENNDFDFTFETWVKKC